MTTGELIQVILMGLLVVVTGIYAWRTFAISKGTERQAQASVEMVKEMREQRMSEAQPYLLLKLEDEPHQREGAPKFTEKADNNMLRITVLNAGKGPAINLRAAIWHATKTYCGDSKGYLAPDEKWGKRKITTDPESEISNEEGWLRKLGEIVTHDGPGVVAVACQDVHGRTWVSYLYLEWHHSVDDHVKAGNQGVVELES